MRAVVQRVAHSSQAVDGKEISRIGQGIVCYLGVEKGDQESDLDWMVKKVGGLRIFPDAEDRMNLSAKDLNYSILVASQFTLFGDVQRGFRPSFSTAEEPLQAKKMYELFMDRLRAFGIKDVQGGVFAADMTIEQVNRGPVTIMLDSRKS